MRIDVYLQEHGLTPTRSRAKEEILASHVTDNGIVVTKPAYSVEEGDSVALVNPLRYVSRGGLKLEAALTSFSLSCEGLVVLDVGASSGGFTDCALQHGAAFVIAVDSGQGQLVDSLRNNPAVLSIEGYNARYMKPSDLPRRPDMAVMDVSFISQTLLHPALFSVLSEGGVLVTLIKPQFEVGRAQIGSGGIVRSEKAREEACARVIASAEAVGFTFVSRIPSPITGGDGNREYLAYFIKRTEP